MACDNKESIIFYCLYAFFSFLLKNNGEDPFQFITWPSAFRNSRDGQGCSDPFFKRWIWPTFEVSQVLRWPFLALILKKPRRVLPPWPSSVLHRVKDSCSVSSNTLSLPSKLKIETRGVGSTIPQSISPDQGFGYSEAFTLWSYISDDNINTDVLKVMWGW